MATGAEIQAALADAIENDLSFADMATLLKRALINAVVGSSTSIEIPWQSTASRGTSIMRMDMGAAERLLDFCTKRAAGGVVAQYVEFPR